MQPETSDAALELYGALDPAFTTGDEDRGYPALLLCNALTSGNISQIHSLVTDSDEALGYQILFAPTNVATRYLPWLAQVAGAVLRPDMDEAQQRDAIKEPEAFGRVTVEAIKAVARRRLTGTRYVKIDERVGGNAWRLRITTIESETPDPALTEAEIIAEQKSIGTVLFFNRVIPWNWKELREEEATWLKVREDFATWEDVRSHEV